MPTKIAKRSSLERYHAKRDFSQTEEPKGAAVRKAQSGELRYLTAIAKSNKQWKSKVVKTSKRAKPAKARKTVKKTAKKTAKASKRKSAKDAGDPPPRFIEPQLATLVGEPPSGDNWVHEIKFDGYRALCRINNGEVTLLTRSNNDWTRKFQSIADQMGDLPIANAILDGEITSSEVSGATSFEALQQALSNTYGHLFPSDDHSKLMDAISRELFTL